MTNVTTTGAAAGQTLAAAAASTSTSGADFNMFLKLLTTQMQNQDPLDPMKTSEYTQQLAQYSQIEQTVQQSGTLKNILAQLTTQSMAQSSGLIGHDVTLATPTAGLGTSPATWSYSVGTAAKSLVATISDASGKVVASPTLEPSAQGSFAWDGTLTGGGRAAPGAYSLAIKATDGNGGAVPVAVASTGRVTDVTVVGGVVSLGVNGIALPASTLIKVGAAAG